MRKLRLVGVNEGRHKGREVGENNNAAFGQHGIDRFCNTI